jgi:hypothetical protein
MNLRMSLWGKKKFKNRSAPASSRTSDLWLPPQKNNPDRPPAALGKKRILDKKPVWGDLKRFLL